MKKVLGYTVGTIYCKKIYFHEETAKLRSPCLVITLHFSKLFHWPFFVVDLQLWYLHGLKLLSRSNQKFDRKKFLIQVN